MVTFLVRKYFSVFKNQKIAHIYMNLELKTMTRHISSVFIHNRCLNVCYISRQTSIGLRVCPCLLWLWLCKLHDHIVLPASFSFFFCDGMYLNMVKVATDIILFLYFFLLISAFSSIISLVGCFYIRPIEGRINDILWISLVQIFVPILFFQTV